MSAQSSIPLCQVIALRKAQGTSDVPVFASALHTKVNTIRVPEQEKQKITSSVSGDPSSGQTLGFPFTLETYPEPKVVLPKSSVVIQKSVVEVPLSSRPYPAKQESGGTVFENYPSTLMLRLSAQDDKQNIQQNPVNPSAYLREDPTLIRSYISTTALWQYLSPASTQEHVVFVTSLIPRFVLSDPGPTLESHHDHGVLDIVALPDHIFAQDRTDVPITLLKRSLWRATHANYNGIIEAVSKQALAIVQQSVVLVEVLDGAARHIGQIAVLVPKTGSQAVAHVVKIALGYYFHVIPTVSCKAGKRRDSFRKLSVRLPGLPGSLRMTILHPSQLILIPKFSGKQFRFALSHSLIIGAVVMGLMTIGPILILEGQSIKQRIENSISGEAQEPAIKENLMDVIRKPEEVPPEEKQFQLLIPAIHANMKVIPNVDAASEKDYTNALQRGVAHAKGSNLPGEKNDQNRTIYIFGHSTNGTWNIARYNALFYSLKDLKPGDEITLWFWGKEYRYVMKEQKIVASDDVSFLQPQTAKDQLILQTCWPPGTTWKRLLVIAEPVQS